MTRSEEVAPGVGLLGIDCPAIARAYRPGSFLHLRVDGDACVLRRPFSIARVRGTEIVLLFRVVGAGTEWMRRRRPGDRVDAMGPLGHPFEVRLGAERAILVGGGLGIAPLLGLADGLARGPFGGSVEILLGLRSAAESFSPALTEEIEGVHWYVATEDGSRGFTGTVVDLLEARLAGGAGRGSAPPALALYAAGPEPMLRACARACLARGLDLQLALEAHMACGVGACRACAVVTWRGGGARARVCREGPVFEAGAILWDGEEP